MDGGKTLILWKIDIVFKIGSIKIPQIPILKRSGNNMYMWPRVKPHEFGIKIKMSKSESAYLITHN